MNSQGGTKFLHQQPTFKPHVTMPGSKPSKPMSARPRQPPPIDRVDVMCNGTRAVFLINTQTILCRCACCVKAGPQGTRVMSPTEFERHAGMSASKKWRRSIKVDVGKDDSNLSLGRWLEQQGFRVNLNTNKAPVVTPGNGGVSISNSQSASFKLAPGPPKPPVITSKVLPALKPASGFASAMPGGGAVKHFASFQDVARDSSNDSETQPMGRMMPAPRSKGLDPEVLAAANALELLKQKGSDDEDGDSDIDNVHGGPTSVHPQAGAGKPTSPQSRAVLHKQQTAFQRVVRGPAGEYDDGEQEDYAEEPVQRRPGQQHVSKQRSQYGHQRMYHARAEAGPQMSDGYSDHASDSAAGDVSENLLASFTRPRLQRPAGPPHVTARGGMAEASTSRHASSSKPGYHRSAGHPSKPRPANHPSRPSGGPGMQQPSNAAQRKSSLPQKRPRGPSTFPFNGLYAMASGASEDTYAAQEHMACSEEDMNQEAAADMAKLHMSRIMDQGLALAAALNQFAPALNSLSPNHQQRMAAQLAAMGLMGFPAWAQLAANPLALLGAQPALKRQCTDASLHFHHLYASGELAASMTGVAQQDDQGVELEAHSEVESEMEGQQQGQGYEEDEEAYEDEDDQQHMPARLMKPPSADQLRAAQGPFTVSDVRQLPQGGLELHGSCPYGNFSGSLKEQMSSA